MEANPEEMEVVVECQKVPNEEAAVENIRALKDQPGERCLVISLHKQLT
jgi:hypothetical protein